MKDQRSDGIPFMKMHGLGNDFVVMDTRAQSVDVTPALAIALGDRHRGVGFDQLVLVEPDKHGADANLVFYNSDGSTAGACGNATRCVARYLMEESGASQLTLRTERGVLTALDKGGALTSVNMGAPQLDWQDVPLSHEMDTLHLPIEGAPTATGMGNPHCTFFVEDAEAVDLETRGAEIEHHPLYPQRTNDQFASILGENHLRMRVWATGGSCQRAF